MTNQLWPNLSEEPAALREAIAIEFFGYLPDSAANHESKRFALASELNRRRAVFVQGKIDEILTWEKMKEQEKDVRFVEQGEYICEVRPK